MRAQGVMCLPLMRLVNHHHLPGQAGQLNGTRLPALPPSTGKGLWQGSVSYTCAWQGGEVATLDCAPFQLRRPLELAGGALSVGLRLRLGGAADAARRAVDARVSVDLAESASAEQRIEFTTQARSGMDFTQTLGIHPRACSCRGARRWRVRCVFWIATRARPGIYPENYPETHPRACACNAIWRGRYRR